MEPVPESRWMRPGIWWGGFVAGIGAQMLFLWLINTVVGPISDFWSGKTLLLIGILLAVPVLSHMYLTIVVGSPKDTFFRGFQFGALFWFIKVLISFFW